MDHPSSEYRGAPFWSWNGKLDPEELRKQIRVMRDMGMGGFFMHARTGLDTAYLSDEAVCAGLAIKTDQVTTSEGVLDSGPYDITLDEPNVLVLDRARYRFDGGDWQPSAYNLFIDRAARTAIDIPRRGDHMARSIRTTHIHRAQVRIHSWSTTITHTHIHGALPAAHSTLLDVSCY